MIYYVSYELFWVTCFFSLQTWIFLNWESFFHDDSARDTIYYKHFGGSSTDFDICIIEPLNEEVLKNSA